MNKKILTLQSRKRLKEMFWIVLGMIGISIGVIGVVNYYITDTPHCHFVDQGYICDMFASSTEKQNFCIQDSIMNSPMTGYNADTGKSYVLSDKDRKSMYNFIVESCK